MSIPKIVEHKIIKLQKRDGTTQYTLTLPKEFAESLTKRRHRLAIYHLSTGDSEHFQRYRFHGKSINHIYARTLGASEALQRGVTSACRSDDELGERDAAALS